MEFLELVKQGAGHLHAAYSVNWTQAQLKRQLKDPSFRELLEEAEEAKLESIEEMAYALAMRGNVRCLELFLYNKARHRGWAPPTQRVEHVQEGKVEISVVQSVKEAAKEMLRSGQLTELSPIVEAEVVADD
jgi:hypothetical protein